MLTVGALSAACGSTTTLPETTATPPLATASVSVQQTGTAPVSILPGSVTYKLDDSGSLVVHLEITSHASTSDTITARASLYNGSGTVIGDAITGGDVSVAPGATVALELNGPPPNGEIVSATFEFTSLPLPGSTSSPSPSPT